MLCLGIVLLASCNQKKNNRKQQTPELSVMEVKPSTEKFYESYSATLKGKQDIDIHPQITGFITKVNVDEGAIVKKGQVLFQIDQVQYQEAVNVAKANVAVAEADVATARLTAKNKKSLAERKIISAYELQLSENELGSCNAQLALAKAELVSAQKDLSYTRITSPTDGIIGKISSRVGALVSPTMTDAITTVSEFTTIYANFSLTEKKILALAKENHLTTGIIKNLPEVQLKMSNDDIYRYPGTIETISGTIDESTGAASIRAAFPNEDGILRSGGTASVILPYSLENCLLIPQSATYEIQDKKFVYTVDENSIVSSTEIEIYPLDNGSQYAVTKGLSAGDKIVIEGITSLRDGTIIKIKSNTL
ncbi:efflux RND transporter periplasmic adaptor subunit [Marinifilum sp. RC60d5]|uniref:efflux RND transporter periplasmic adaptor subunit n=1 Tax=Marinifilum sp. RC60d5 TaxID=3458414 RepID=UPI00403514BE